MPERRADSSSGVVPAAMGATTLAAVATSLLAGAWLGRIAASLLIGIGLALSFLGLAKARRSLRFSNTWLPETITALKRSVGGEVETMPPSGAAATFHLRAAITAVRRTLDETRVSQEQLECLLANMREAIFVVDAEGVIQRANDAAAAMLESLRDDLIGRQIAAVLTNCDRQSDRAAEDSGPRDSVLEGSCGRRIPVAVTVHPVSTNEDGSASLLYVAKSLDERQRAERRMRYLATTDALTRVPNRMQLEHLLQRSIATAKQQQQYVGLLYLDIDNFKDVNDTFGHAAGDTSLATLAHRLSDAVPAGAVVGRLAGDEFSVVLAPFESIAQLADCAAEIAHELLDAVGRPFFLRGEEISMTMSIGIALYPRDGDNVVELWRRADAALSQAKQAGGNCFEFYSEDLRSPAEHRLTLKNRLRRAFERDELRLHYQPKYDLRTGRISGAEALIRWDVPERGLVFPSDFIPLAEETNLILQIGDWVLDRVCSDYRSWQRWVPSPCRISMNLSLRQLQQRCFLEGIQDVFKRYSVAPACIELEITETTLMQDAERAIRMLNSLHALGIPLAIDDFGTGYSSLTALQQFPISTLKIDQSFIRGAPRDRESVMIVQGIIQLAHSLDLEVVAEGVETREQWDFLRRQRCDHGQGLWLGDAMTAEELCRLLAEPRQGPRFGGLPAPVRGCMASDQGVRYILAEENLGTGDN
jgi:diguanylate cyclase (GGDEF)-like protein/PAS domain S-box-containing protein